MPIRFTSAKSLVRLLRAGLRKQIFYRDGHPRSGQCCHLTPMRDPSGLKAAEVTQLSWPVEGVAISC